MPTKRNMKNYALVEVIQPKDYMTLVKDKLCHSVEEIILSYVTYDSRKQTHECKLNINNVMSDLCERFMNTYIITCGVEYELRSTKLSDKYKVFHTGWNGWMWGKTKCNVCRKKFLNIQSKITQYSEEATTSDNWWLGDVCDKCDDRYNIKRLFNNEDEDVIVDFMLEICDGETQAERDEIAYNWIGMRQDGDDDY